jgi:hypothetical protein
MDTSLDYAGQVWIWSWSDNWPGSVGDPEISKRGAHSQKGGPTPEIEKKKLTYFGSQILSY